MGQIERDGGAGVVISELFKNGGTSRDQLQA
jgi:hypothetical protein